VYVCDYKGGVGFETGFIDHLTRDSWLHLIIAPSLISTLYKSLEHTEYCSQSVTVSTTRSLVTASNSGDCSASALTSSPADSQQHRLIMASLSWNKVPIWGLRPDLYYCLPVTGFLMWGALSDERTGLSFARVTVSSSKSFVSMYNLHFTCY
jgi:hypothetical protein